MNESVEKPSAVLIMGVAGSGKTLIGTKLAEKLGWKFVDGDTFHSSANVSKMSQGIPLTDEDRQPWLHDISNWIVEHIKADTPTIVACSALRWRYRRILLPQEIKKHVVLICLSGSFELIDERIQSRTDHFMPASLLSSQYDAFEPPDEDEQALMIDISKTPDDIVNTILQHI